MKHFIQPQLVDDESIGEIDTFHGTSGTCWKPRMDGIWWNNPWRKRRTFFERKWELRRFHLEVTNSRRAIQTFGMRTVLFQQFAIACIPLYQIWKARAAKTDNIVLNVLLAPVLYAGPANDIGGPEHNLILAAPLTRIL